MSRSRIRPSRTRALAALSLSALALTATGVLAPPATAGPRQSSVVGERPVAWTPHVLNGSVKTIAQVGETVVVGGTFTRVAPAGGGRDIARDHVFAFDAATGEIHDDFAPELNGPVTSVVAGPADSVYVGGSFTTVDGEPQRGLARLSTDDGDPVPGFTAVLDNGMVHRLAEQGGDLYAVGSFTGINGQRRTGLARLDGDTGAVDRGFDITVSKPRSGHLRVHEIAVSPDGRRVLVNGPFTRVEGQRRYQIAMIDTSAATARLSGWSTNAYAAECDYERRDAYLYQMDFAPDGSYFAVVTSGGPRKKPGLCQTAARFETTDRAGSRPTWVNHTGGNSLYSVEITGAAVYVGGHQQWLDNPDGFKEKGPGAVDRKGVGAIDPETGRALAWNPGRERGKGVYALTATSNGLYVGSDTETLAGERHERLGMFPLQG